MRHLGYARILGFCAVLCTLLLYGCAGGGLGVFPFFYRLTNGIVDVAAVDLQVDKQVAATNVAFGDSTAYVETDTSPPTLIFFDLLEAGTSNFIDSIVFTKQRDISVHLFGVGMDNPGPLQPQGRLVPVNVNRRTPQGNNARLVVVHGFVRAAGTQTPNIDFFRSGQIGALISDLEFGNAETITLAEGTYDFEVRIAGLMSGTLMTTPSPVTIEARKVYIVMLRGLEGGAGALAPQIYIFEEPIHDP